MGIFFPSYKETFSNHFHQSIICFPRHKFRFQVKTLMEQSNIPILHGVITTYFGLLCHSVTIPTSTESFVLL